MSYKVKADLLSGSVLPVNCRILSGELHPALSAVFKGGMTLKIVATAAYSAFYDMYFICARDRVMVYNCSDSTVSWKLFRCGAHPFFIEDTDGGVPRMIVINASKALIFKEGEFSDVAYGANLYCGVMHCGRLFAADNENRLKLCWSGEGGLSDWEEGMHGSGYLILDPERGDIIDILEYGEKLVLVRESGLTVLSMFGAPENFSVEITNTDTDAIVADTAKVAGGKLIFCTSSGLYSFNGSVIEKVNHALADRVYAPEKAQAFGDKYFLSCSVSGFGRAVLCYDGGAYIIDIDAKTMCAAEGIAVFGSGGIYKLEAGDEYRLICKDVSFGSGKSKTVKEVYLDTRGADIEIDSGRAKRSFTNISGTVKPNLRGKKFSITIKGSNPVYAAAATAEVLNAI